MQRWEHGDILVRREILGLHDVPFPEPLPAWHHRCWSALAVRVVEDTPEQLVTYIASGAELASPPGPWPSPDHLHPWHGRDAWQGNGVLMVQRPGDAYAVWHFWLGEERVFAGWYFNLQADFVRRDDGYDTQDFELDIVVDPDRQWKLKDDELLDQRVAEGRFTGAQARWIRDVGTSLTTALDAGEPLWDPAWVEWEPPAEWTGTRLPEGWLTR